MATRRDILEGQALELMTDGDLEWEKNKLIKELYKLKENEDEIERAEITTSVKGIHLRQIRRKRREKEKEIKEISLELEERQYEQRDKEEEEDIEAAADAMEKLTADTTALDKGTLKAESEDKYYRSSRLCSTYKEKIKELKIDIENLLENRDEQLTEHAREKRMIEVKTKIETVKNLAADYRKYNNDMTSLAKATDVQILIDNLADVNSITNNLIAKLGYEEDLNKKKLTYKRQKN